MSGVYYILAGFGLVYLAVLVVSIAACACASRADEEAGR